MLRLVRLIDGGLSVLHPEHRSFFWLEYFVSDAACHPGSLLQVNCLAFNPFNEWILATGSADRTVSLFDIRKITQSLHTFLNHTCVVNDLNIIFYCCSYILVWPTAKFDFWCFVLAARKFSR